MKLRPLGFTMGFAGLTATANALELTDYTNTVSEYTNAEVSVQLNAKDGNQEQASYDVTFIGDFEKNYSSDDRVWQFDANANVNASRGADTQDNAEQGYDSVGSYFLNNYFESGGKTYWFGDTNLGLRKLNGADGADDPFVKVGAGVGYGRVIIATPLAVALRVVEELTRLGVLIRQPTDETLTRLAHVISKEEQYRASSNDTQDYRRQWFESIESVLNNDGLLRDGGLGAVGSIALNDVVIDERIAARKYGWKVQVGLGYVLSNYDNSDSDPSVDFLFEYAHPLSRDLQIDNVFTVSTVLTDDTTYIVGNDLSLNYEVSDTVDWENGWRYTAILPGESTLNDVRTNSLYTTFNFEASKQLDVYLTFLLSDVEDKIENGNEETEKSLFVGVTHEFR